jgi:hypothetical protein
MGGDDNVMFGFYQSNRFTIAGITESFLVYNCANYLGKSMSDQKITTHNDVSTLFRTDG